MRAAFFYFLSHVYNNNNYVAERCCAHPRAPLSLRLMTPILISSYLCVKVGLRGGSRCSPWRRRQERRSWFSGFPTFSARRRRTYIIIRRLLLLLLCVYMYIYIIYAHTDGQSFRGVSASVYVDRPTRPPSHRGYRRRRL